jgi:4-alpha-glucanotransferase
MKSKDLPRCSGIWLPLFSLPSRFGIGDLGPEAYRFVDFLRESGQRVWQLLPLGPTTARADHSPYHATSTFAFNLLLISPELLVEDGLLGKKEIAKAPRLAEACIDYPAVVRGKRAFLAAACRRFRRMPAVEGYSQFCHDQAGWLDDYAQFAAFKTHFRGAAWHRWPAAIRHRRPAATKALAGHLGDRMERIKIVQYLFHRQWIRLRAYCRANGVELFGDLPIYMLHDSADVWSRPNLFKLAGDSRPVAVSGVPPDYFSATGQLWGHPVFNWPFHRRTRYDWWVRRLAHHLELFDLLRIDHFRGLVAYWEVPAGRKTAVGGRWVAAPGEDLFAELRQRLPRLPLIAEDLGLITADVRHLMQRHGFTGMRVLQFGFDGDPASNENAMIHVPENCVVYTGTHDNNTARGWFETEATAVEKKRLAAVVGGAAAGVAWQLIRLAMLSRARLAVVSVQDLLALEARARINTPGRMEGNWRWRMTRGQFAALPRQRLRDLTEASGRLGAGSAEVLFT